MLLALIVHSGCSFTVSRRTVVGGSIASLGLARRPLPALAVEEPEAVQRLLALVEGRRAQQWQPEERAQVDRLIEEVVALQAPWNREDLRGRWKLAYLQPGPGGGGVDRHASMIKLLPSSPHSRGHSPLPRLRRRARAWSKPPIAQAFRPTQAHPLPRAAVERQLPGVRRGERDQRGRAARPGACHR